MALATADGRRGGNSPTGRWRPAGLSWAMRGGVSYAAFGVTEG